MPRPASPGHSMSSTVNENKPAWCSPGRPHSTPHSTLMRTGKGKPLGELKPGNRGPNVDVPIKAEKVLIPKKVPIAKDSPITLAARKKVKAPPPSPAAVVASTAAVVSIQNPSVAVVTSRPKAVKPAVTDETPPRTRPIKKVITALVTPTNKFRKPLAVGGTPKSSIPKVSTAKGSTPASRSRERSQASEETPTRKVKENSQRAAAAIQQIQKSGSKDKAQQTFSTWACSAAVRNKRTSPTPGRPPVKHLFLSPQVSKKNAKKDQLRKSVESHGIWVGSIPQRKRAPLDKREGDSEMPPPAQPTNSPEIPKRGSREASGEGIRGYFGAGPMVAPDGMGFVRDRRKCKPRGTLMVGEEGLSLESDSSSVVESSIQMPLPSVASVEWMMNNGTMNDYPSGHAESTSLSGMTFCENQSRESFPKERTSQELGGIAFLHQLRQSRENGDVYSHQSRRSQPYLERWRQLQLSREGSVFQTGQSQQNGDDVLQRVERTGAASSDMEDEDITIDWRQGLPADSMEIISARESLVVEKKPELIRSSISFTSSWAPPPDGNRRLSGNAKTWYSPESPWYGFSPITPEFHRNSQLPEGGSKAIDALLAGSVRRRIITDQSSPSDKVDMSSTSLPQPVQAVNLFDSANSLSALSSQDTSSSFQFAPRNSYARATDIEVEPIPLDTFICQTSSPVERSLFGEDLLCQTASPIDEIYSGACSIDCSVSCSRNCSVDCSIDGSIDCSIDCSMDASGDDEVEYASPIMGKYSSPEKCSSPIASIDKGEANMGARAARRSSISRTLEELMRHNFTL